MLTSLLDVLDLTGNVNNNLLSTVAVKLLKFGDGAVHAAQLLERYALLLENEVARQLMSRCMTVCARCSPQGEAQYTVGGKAWGDRVQYSYRSIGEQFLGAGPRLALLHSLLLPQRAVQAVDELPPQSMVIKLTFSTMRQWCYLSQGLCGTCGEWLWSKPIVGTLWLQSMLEWRTSP
jgi:hypothetical protein